MMIVERNAAENRNPFQSSWELGDIFNSIPKIIEERAKQFPDHVAIIYENRHLTYRNLIHKMNLLSRYIAQSVKFPEGIVCVAMERSPDLIIALLAILKAGAVYVPLDPHHPRERLQFIVDDLKPALLIKSSNRDAPIISAGCNQIAFDEAEKKASTIREWGTFKEIFPDQLAYILYTSGSTGNPKGVMISHAALINCLSSFISLLPITQEDRFLSVTTPSFDIAGLEYYAPLLSGGTLIIAPEIIASQGSRLLELLRTRRCTLMQATPISWQMLLEAGWQPPVDFKILCGGESLPPSLFRNLLSHPVRLYNLYGPTETTIWSTFADFMPDDLNKEIHIGQPIAQTTIHITPLEDAEEDNKGELCIAGLGLARGYWNRPDLTAERFIPNSYAHRIDSRLYERLYCTGDLAAFDDDHLLKCLGRIDNQVKIRGYRIELEEIESCLNKQQSVKRAIVQAESALNGVNRLVAYVIPNNGHSEANRLAHELRQSLAKHLPEYMIPQAYCMMDAFPLTPNGKVNRKALTQSSSRFDLNRESPQVPMSTLEEIIYRICKQELQVSEIGLEKDLFSLGLDSLSCLKISLKLSSLGYTISERAIFSCRTIKNINNHIQANSGSCTPRQPKIHPHKVAKALASYGQQRLWLMDKLLPEQGKYNVAYAFRIKGELCHVKLKAACRTLIHRHAIFRTILIEEKGVIYQHIISAEKAPIAFEFLQVEEDRVEEFLTAQANRSFDISAAPLFNFSVLHIHPNEHVLIIVMHHLLIDEWSLNVFFRELNFLYQNDNREDLLPALPITYADFSDWQRQCFQDGCFARQAEYWQQNLGNGFQEPMIHADHKRVGHSGYCTIQVSHVIHQPIAASFNQLLEKEHASLFMGMASILSLFLYRYSNRSEIVIGAPIANRHYPEVENLVGFLINMVSIKCDLHDGLSFRRHLELTKQAVLDAYENQDIPFDEVVKLLNGKHIVGVHPIFQVVLILQNELDKPLWEGLEIEEIEMEKKIENPSPFDLTVWVKPSKGSLEIRFEYAKELFDVSKMREFGKHLETLVEAIVANPDCNISQVPLYNLAQLQQAIHWGETRPFDADDGVIERLIKHAYDYPSRIAVIYKDQYLTYGGLLHSVNHLAAHFVSLGVGFEDPVCILSERNADFIVAFLALLKLGAAYVPIDPKIPLERIQSILFQCRPKLLLTNEELLSLGREAAAGLIPAKVIRELLEARPECQIPFYPTPLPKNRLTYVIFTSGSTGTPKGVMVEHEGMINHLYAKVHDLQLAHHDRIAQTATQAFDISIWQFLVGTFIGGTTWICDTEQFWNPEQFVKGLRHYKVSIAETVPSHIGMLLDVVEGSSTHELTAGLCLRYFLSTGEALHSSLARRWFTRFADIPLVNAYGPTECSDDVTHYILRKEGQTTSDIVPITGTVNNLAIYFLDHVQNFSPFGADSELCVGGVGVGRGYLNDPEKTSLSFLPDPYASKPGSRMYRTGDLTRVSISKDILYLGRIDSQIKLRGYRIELEEIEEQLERHSEVKRAKVVLMEGKDKATKIVAYITCEVLNRSRVEQENLISNIRQFLSDSLPVYMIPSLFMLLQSFPLNINGKIDTKRLPAPAEIEHAPYVPPRNLTERMTQAIFCKLLNKGNLSIFDNIFDMGVNSLLAIRVLTEIKKTFHNNISLTDIFKYPTLADLSKRIEERDRVMEEGSYRQLRVGSISAPPLFMTHASDGLSFSYSKLLSDNKKYSVYCFHDPYFGNSEKKFSMLEEMAYHYACQLKTLQPSGPYYLGGWSFGGAVAFEMASQLEDFGEIIGKVFMIDSYIGNAVSALPNESDFNRVLERYGIDKKSAENRSFIEEMINNHTLLANYCPKMRTFPTLLFKAGNKTEGFLDHDPCNGWEPYSKGMKVTELPTDHYQVFKIQESLDIIEACILKEMEGSEFLEK